MLESLSSDVPPQNLSTLPYTSLYLSCLSLCLYAIFRPIGGPDISMFLSNIIGLFMACYAFYILLRKFPPQQPCALPVSLTDLSSTREAIERQIYATLFIGLLLSIWQFTAPIGPKDTRLWTGYLATVFTWVCLSAPIAHIRHVIIARDSSDMSFPYIAIALILSLLWMIYGVCLHDSTIIVQNLVSTLASAFEGFIYVFFWVRKKSDT